MEDTLQYDKITEENDVRHGFRCLEESFKILMR